MIDDSANTLIQDSFVTLSIFLPHYHCHYIQTAIQVNEFRRTQCTRIASIRAECFVHAIQLTGTKDENQIEFYHVLKAMFEERLTETLSIDFRSMEIKDHLHL